MYIYEATFPYIFSKGVAHLADGEVSVITQMIGRVHFLSTQKKTKHFESL